MVAAGQALVAFDTAQAASERAELLGRWQVKAVEAARLDAEQAGLPLAIDASLAGHGRTSWRRHSPPSRPGATPQLPARRGVAAGAGPARGARHRGGGAGAAAQPAAAGPRGARRGTGAGEARPLPEPEAVAVEREASDDAGELAKAEAAAAASRAALAEAESRLAGVDKEWRSGVLGELGQATAERDRLAEQLRARTGVVEDLVLRAPVAGVVQDLAVAGAGQSVAAHETLMKLVPLGDGLAVEARVANEDIGRVTVGMPATIKVRAFDYLRYGSVEGSVARVAADASPGPEDRRAGLHRHGRRPTPRASAQAPASSTWRPGMVVDVEVKVGRADDPLLPDRPHLPPQGGVQGDLNAKVSRPRDRRP